MPQDLFINGQIESGRGPAIAILHPAYGARVASVAFASADQVDAAVKPYTSEARRVPRRYEEIRLGDSWVNDPVVDHQAVLFGGSGASGRARELGIEGLFAFTDVTHVHWDIDFQAMSWWYPYKE